MLILLPKKFHFMLVKGVLSYQYTQADEHTIRIARYTRGDKLDSFLVPREEARQHYLRMLKNGWERF